MNKVSIILLITLFGGIRAMEEYDVMPYCCDVDTASITVPCITLPSAVILKECLCCYLSESAVEQTGLCAELADRRFTVFEVRMMVNSAITMLINSAHVFLNREIMSREFIDQKSVCEGMILDALVKVSSNYGFERVMVSE